MSAPLKTKINADAVPNPLPNVLSQAIIANGMVYCSGNIATDPATGKLVEGNIGARTHQILKNLTVILEAAGTTMENVVKVNVFITDYKDFAILNEAYSQYFGDDKPSRSCIGAACLPMNTDIEIECIAVLPASSKL